jgi:hypothetical protein
MLRRSITCTTGKERQHFLAMVKLLEDKMNAQHDANAAAQVPIIIRGKFDQILFFLPAHSSILPSSNRPA